MKNPLKKTNYKKKCEEAKKLCDELHGVIGELVETGAKVQRENKNLDLRCQNLEIEINKLRRENKRLEELACENKQKAVKAQQDLNEERLKAALLLAAANKLTLENLQLRRGIIPETNEAEKFKEVISSGKSD